MKTLALLPADRIGLSREEAAAYINVSPNTFDMLVRRGDMPRAKHVGSRRIWSRREVEQAFDRLDSEGGEGKTNPDYDDERGSPPWEGRAA